MRTGPQVRQHEVPYVRGGGVLAGLVGTGQLADRVFRNVSGEGGLGQEQRRTIRQVHHLRIGAAVAGVDDRDVADVESQAYVGYEVQLRPRRHLKRADGKAITGSELLKDVVSGEHLAVQGQHR